MFRKRRRDSQRVEGSLVTGDVIQIQGVAGNVYVGTAAPMVRSSYLEQVRRIAPEQLRDRDAELNELAAFCTEPDRGPYMWWRARAWAGKSALMSWFVLHPPPSVQVVSFFITARFKGQDDRVAFTDALMEQLADLLGQSMPAYLTETTREPHMLLMLSEAAEACRQRGHRLVLLVDGLDEDRGVTTGADAYSIAALLPSRPAAGMRVVVAGRPDPPIPMDLPSDHPLRDPRIVRELGDSPWADVVKGDMQRELKRLLQGTQAEQDLLGLVTAAGGGLSAQDLAELTGVSQFEVEQNLQAVAGRTFVSYLSFWQPGMAPEVYVLGHEELQAAATEYLGESRLAGYRERLLAWAEGYRQRDWPTGTPEYLLRGYFRMLRAAGDVPGLLACATDWARHHRILEVTGGDTAALAEVTAAQDVLQGLDVPDPVNMARLAVHRDGIVERNAHIPVALPAVWATLGQPARAEALALAVIGHQVEALTALTRALAEAGFDERAAEMALRAQTLARAAHQPQEPTSVAKMLVGMGDRERARETALAALEVARADAQPVIRARELADVAEVLAAAGYPGDVLGVLPAITDPVALADTLAVLTEALVAAGDLDQAREIVASAEELARAVTNSWEQPGTLSGLARAAAAVGYLDRASVVAAAITDPQQRAEALTRLVRALAAAGDHKGAKETGLQAREAALAVTYEQGQAEALARLAAAQAASGDEQEAHKTALRSQKTALRLEKQARADRSVSQEHSLASAVEVMAISVVTLATVEDLEKAEETALRAADTATVIGDLPSRATALTHAAKALAAAQAFEQAEKTALLAEEVARGITDLSHLENLADLAEALAGAGDLALAREIARRLVEEITPGLRDVMQIAPSSLVKALVATGDLKYAEELARQITTDIQSIPLHAVVQALAKAGNLDRAVELAQSIIEPDDSARELAALVAAMAAAGDLEQAQDTARSITVADYRARALGALLEVLGSSGDREQVRPLAEQAAHAARAVKQRNRAAAALAAVAKSLAVAGESEQARMLAQEAVQAAQGVSDRWQQPGALAAAAAALVAVGGLDQAEEAIRGIADPDRQQEALAALVERIAEAGHRKRAAALAHRITSPGQQATALAAAGELDSAEEVARRVTDPAERAISLMSVALAAGPERAHSLSAAAVTEALAVCRWTQLLGYLSKLQPAVLSAIASEYLRQRPQRSPVGESA